MKVLSSDGTRTLRARRVAGFRLAWLCGWKGRVSLPKERIVVYESIYFVRVLQTRSLSIDFPI
jgi:hypothetical protein